MSGQGDTLTGASIAESILALENGALARWCAGDPSGFLEVCAADVVYFDPFLDQRLDGLVALTQYYEALRGKISAERYEIRDPRVQSSADLAVLTFHFVSFAHGEVASRWNCTEVYRHDAKGWRIIQSHWSLTHPG